MLLIGGTIFGIKNYRQQKKQKSSQPEKKTTLQTLKETVLIPLTGGKSVVNN